MVYLKGFSKMHPASLVDSSIHSQALLELLHTKVSRTLNNYVVDCVVDTVHTALIQSGATSCRPHIRDSQRTKLLDFLDRIVYKADIKVPVLLVALVYIERAKPNLQITTEQWAYERVCLGAIMLAYKFVNDATLKNHRWAVCTGVFGTGDVGRVEREFLDVLDYHLNFTEDDILSHHGAIKALTQSNRQIYSRSPFYSPPAPTRHHTYPSSPVTQRKFDIPMDVDSDSDSECCSSSSSSSDDSSLPATPQTSSSEISVPRAKVAGVDISTSPSSPLSQSKSVSSGFTLKYLNFIPPPATSRRVLDL
ncbi:hypothetical protein C8Q75DRAFT_877279 [Abortiporus biennis]|nr:hypothetical protein C8Q75DRAFT_877279 [Abortiporus biennis]